MEQKPWMWFHYQEMKVKWQCRTEKKRSGPAESLVLNKMLYYYLLIIQFIKYSDAISYCFSFMITSFIRKVSVYVCPHLDWGPALTFAVIINLLIKFEVFIYLFFFFWPRFSLVTRMFFLFKCNDSFKSTASHFSTKGWNGRLDISKTQTTNFQSWKSQ